MSSNHSICCGQTEVPVLDYFQRTYVGVPGRGGRHRGLIPLMFTITLWNMHDRVQANLPRTNNNLEGWHNGFGGRFEVTRTGIWKFIDIIKQDNAVHHTNIAQFQAGGLPLKQRKNYRELNDRLRRLVNACPNRQRIEYLRISHNLAEF